MVTRWCVSLRSAVAPYCSPTQAPLHALGLPEQRSASGVARTRLNKGLQFGLFPVTGPLIFTANKAPLPFGTLLPTEQIDKYKDMVVL